MRDRSRPEHPPDSLAVALDAVDDRWSLHVIRAISFGAVRYTDILREVGAPRDVLSTRLRTLTENGVLEPADPARGRLAGYALTAKGRDLVQVVLVLKRWGDTYRDPATPTVELDHDLCGERFEAQVCCAACGETYHFGDLSLAVPD